MKPNTLPTLLLTLLVAVACVGQSRLVINTGSTSNDGTGDSLRTASLKSNTNFATLWATLYTNGVGKLVPLMNLTNNVEIDGKLTNDFRLDDMAIIELDSRQWYASGIDLADLSGGLVSLRAETNLFVLTPSVIAITAKTNQVLMLMDSSTDDAGKAEFRPFPPVMTTTERNAMSSPAEGTLVYDSTLHKLVFRTASAWETVTSN